MDADHDPNKLLQRLRTAYKRSLADGAKFWRALNLRVSQGTIAASAVAEVALLGLEQMSESEPTSLGMSACDALRRHGDGQHLHRLQELRPHLPARKGLRDWRVDADRARDVLVARHQGKCTCTVDARHRAPVPGEQWTITSEHTDRQRYCVVYDVRCRQCGAQWQVERDDSYHYPTFRWSKA